MRAFVGIALPDELRAALEAAIQVVRRGDHRWHDAKWVAPENIHVTVAFLGNISAEDGELLADDLAARYAACDVPMLEYAGLRAVPGTRHARMVWATFDDPGDLCARIATETFDAAARIGVPPPERDFSAHATLVRARKPANLDAEVLTQAEEAVRDALGGGGEFLSGPSPRVPVGSVDLIESRLTPTGPVYTPVRTIAVGR